MDDAAFEDLELHVLTLAFQIEGLKKNATINKQRNSLKIGITKDNMTSR